MTHIPFQGQRYTQVLASPMIGEVLAFKARKEVTDVSWFRKRVGTVPHGELSPLSSDKVYVGGTSGR